MKNKLNLKGQFNNSQTAVNPTEVGPATVNRRSRLMSVLCLLTLLTLGVGNAWAGTPNISGFGLQFRDDSGTWFKTGTKGDGGIQELDLGSKTNLKIVYIYANGNKNGGNLCGDNYFKYEVYGTTGVANWGGEKRKECNWSGDVPTYKWGTENSNTAWLDLVQNRKPGNYRMEFYMSFNGNSSSSGCDSWYDCKYGGGNWKFTWSIPDPTITITGADALVVGTSTNIKATISDYPVGATLTKLQVSGNIASAKSNTGTSSSITISSVTPNASGANGITVTATVTYGTAGTKTYTYYYNVTPPAVSDFTITPSGQIGGTGTSGDPYLVTYNGSITFGLSGATKAATDDNSTAQYSTDGSNYGTTGTYISKTHSSVTKTTNQNWVYKARLKNNTTSTLLGAIKEKTVYWKVPTSTITLDDNGSYGGNGSATATHGKNALSSITAPTRTGYDVEGYYNNNTYTQKVAAVNGTLQVSTAYTTSGGLWNSTSNQTLYTKWTAHTYTVTLNAGTGGSGSGTMTVDYDATAYKTFSHTIAKTGYNLTGWYTAASGGTKVLNENGSFAGATVTGYITSSKWSKAANCTLYAQWTPKSYTVTLEVGGANHGNTAGATLSQSVTYNGATTTVPNRPHAANGYGFTGYYTSSGTKVINADGTWIASVAGYTDDSGNWIHDGDVTLYANYVKAMISGFTFDAAAVEPSGEVGVTPIISPTPEGTMVVCWRVLYSNGNEIEPKIDVTPHPSGINNKVTFTAPATSGTYKVEATLHLGSDCEAEAWGEPAVQNFQVAGDHIVTVQYKCGNTTIAASTTVNGKPLEWSEAITAPDDIVGYSFSKWVAVDGVTITADNGTTSVTESTSRTIRIKATYDGKLRAEYTRKNVIYFNNTLGWDDVWVYFYNSNKYWADGYGTGAWKGKTFEGNKPYWETEHGHMTRIEGTNIWYFDYTAAGYTTRPNVAFANMDKSNSTDTNEGDNSKAYFSNTTSKPIQVVRRGDHNATLPMFVPVVGQTAVKLNSNKAEYYSNGYWMNYPENTGYTLKIYNQPTVDGAVELRSIPFEFTEDKNMPMTLTVNLEAGKTYGFKINRADNRYYGNNGTMTVNTTNWAMTEKVENTNTANCGLKTTAAGDYIFTLNYFDVSSVYEYRVGVTYPVAKGDYQVLYKDDTMSEWFKSDILPKANEADTVSFFVRKEKRPILKLQKCTDIGTGTVTWTDTVDNLLSEGIPAAITKDSVYNFIFAKAATGKLQHTNTEGYTGNYYIRTDCAGATKWDNYRAADHMMTYSEYSERNSDYTHYFMSHIWSGVNVKYVVANDYSPNISDTLIRSSYRGGDASHVDENGNILAEANIRFMWNKNNNAVYRAYLSGGKEDGSKFLVLRGTDSDNIKSQAGEVLTGDSKANPGNNHGAGAHCMQFTDDENWIYETTVQVLPSSYVKLFAKFNGEHYFYYKGNDNNLFNDTKIDGIPNAIQLITGTGSDYVKVRVIYDFKTDRLLAAYLPSGNISTPMPINADVMFIREHQGDIDQLTFSKASEESPMGAITKIKTAYAVMRFNKWTLNNKSTINSGTKETPVHLPLASPLSRYERDVFYVSFPFDVNLNEVFGFGTYGVHWIMEYYDGEARAANGFWKDTPSYWRFITNRNGYVLKKNVGYILALDLDELGEESSVWANNNERAELFFPSSGTMPDITSGTVTAKLDKHTCTIVRNGSDRTKADSHWNIMGVPTYLNTNAASFANDTWTTSFGPKFLYTWNSADNTLTPTTATGFTYHAMHAYTVQYYDTVKWTTSVSPSPIVARQKQEPSVYEWCLELQQNDQMTDRTYVRMSDEEEVTSGFEFGYDMSKSMNWDKANIYTFIGSETVAGNSLPLQSEQTTVVPIGVTIKNAGEYTFAMPDGTNGVGVTLVDTEANVRTSLSALDYTVSLEAGEYTGRFVLEISPVQNTPTDIEAVSVQPSEVRKVMIDGILYIVKDGKMYDARGTRVE